jgi:hypothetical protein
MIDTWLTIGGACFGKAGVQKIEDTDGSLGNSNGILTNTLGGIFGAAINSVVPGARDGLMSPGFTITPTAVGISSPVTDLFDQTPGNTFSVTNGAIAALGGVVGTTTSNAILIGQFTTNGIFSFSLNVQLQNTLTLTSEIFVPENPTGLEFVFPTLGYSSGATSTTNPVDTTKTSLKNFENKNAEISVFPNPSTDSFNFSVTQVSEGADNFYSIYDISGRAIIVRPFGRVSGTFSENVNISEFTPGLYFLNVSIDGVVTTKKIIKE